MYREYALTLKWVWMWVSKVIFQKEHVRVIVGRKTGHLSSLFVAWMGAWLCKSVILMGDTVRVCFFFFFLPLLLFLVTIARDRSRGVRNKIIWHIFFQLLDTLPVCQDFNRQVCNRPACKFIHLSDGEFSWSAATRRDALIPLSDGNIFFPHVPFFFSLLSPLNISFRRTFHWFSFYSLFFIFLIRWFLATERRWVRMQAVITYR